jgi:excisionase family DNA binding protein
MTVRDVAEYLQFGHAKIYKMARAGEVPAVRIGKEWRFKRDALDGWLNAFQHLRVGVNLEKHLHRIR